MPVDGERLPRLVLERTHYRVGAGDQDENLRLVLVQQAPRHCRVGRIRDHGPDVRADGGQLGKRRAGPGDRDHRSASLGERTGDPTPQTPASANDDSGPARQVIVIGHCLSPSCGHNSLAWPAPPMTLTPAPLADSVDQAYTPTLKLENLPQFKPTTTFRRRKERLPFTGDQRINNKPEFIHQPGIDKARRSSSAPN